MNTKFTPFVVGFAVVILAAGVVLFQNAHKTARPMTTSKTPTESTTTSGSPSSTSYTLAQVATHNNKTSCWTAINGSVYDVTSWIPLHPGGADAILSLCGHDGSSAFNAQHGGQAQPATELASFKIGVLK